MTSGLRTVTTRALRHLDHTVGRWASPARVLVDVRTPLNLAVLRPVWRHLIGDPRVHLGFVAEDASAVTSALAPDHLEGALLERDAATWMRWDLSLSADAWNHASLRRCRRTIQFFHGVAGKYDLDAPHALAAAGLHRFDRLAFINRDRMQRYLRSGAIRPEQAVLVGYPKIDDLLNGVWSAAAVRQSLGFSPSGPTVLYAPTFSPASSLHVAGPQIVSALLGTGASVIVKLHERSLTPDARYTNGIDWPVELACFASHPRFALARSADAGPFLSAADVLVTDHSTVGFEFALLDRPILVFDAPELKEAARIDDEKWTLLRSMADVVDTPDRLSTGVTRALADPGRLRVARQRAHELFAYPGQATARALAVVYELLDMEMTPAGQLASHPRRHEPRCRTEPRTPS